MVFYFNDWSVRTIDIHTRNRLSDRSIDDNSSSGNLVGMIKLNVHIIESFGGLTVNIVPKITCHYLLIKQSSNGTHKSVLPSIVADMIRLTSAFRIGEHATVLHFLTTKLCPRW